MKKTAKSSKTIRANKRKATMRAKHRRQRAENHLTPSPCAHRDRYPKRVRPKMNTKVLGLGNELHWLMLTRQALRRDAGEDPFPKVWLR